MANPMHKLELGIDRALDGVYLALEGLDELTDKPFGVRSHLDAAKRELREALGLVPPGADGLVQSTVEETHREPRWPDPGTITSL